MIKRAAVLLVLATGCSGILAIPEVVQGQLVVASGDGQTAQVGTALAAPLVATIEDANHNAMAGVPVVFAVTAGGGSLSSTTVMTDAKGQAKTLLTLGTTAGANRVEAHPSGVADLTAVFTATGTAGPASHMALVSGDGQRGAVASSLTAPLVVAVTDDHQNPVSGATVGFVATSGGGTVVTASPTTDAAGQARTAFTLGGGLGANTVEARAPLSGSPIVFSATAYAATATQLLTVSGNNQSGTVAMPLAAPLVVVVKDAYANPVSGYTVSFVVTSGGGSLSAATAVTDAAGQAQTVLTPGMTTGANTVEARAPGLAGSPSVFTATGHAGAASRILLASGDNQSGTVATAPAAPLVVTVEDAYDNTVSGVSVSFVVTGGGGSVSAGTAATNGAGQAQTTLTLGTTAGANTVEARVTGLTGSPVVFTASGKAGAASKILLASGSGQTATVATALASPFVAVVQDAYSNPVTGYTVSFVVTAGGGTLSASSAATSSAGLAATTLTLGTTAGGNSVEARAATLTGSPVVFGATGRAGAATQISLTSGSGQSGTVATALASPFVATVADGYGNPVAGVTVSFVVTGGGGSVSAASAATNSAGRAQTTLTLATTAGANSVEARVSGLTGSPVVFGATGTAGAATQIVLGSGSGQSGTVATALAAPFVATVKDIYGNPVTGTTVAFVVTANNGTVSAPSVASNGLGQAQSTLTLGTVVGGNTVEARATGLTGSPVLFAASGGPGAPSQVTASGDLQASFAHTPLGPYSVIVRDAYGNYTPGVTVGFTVTSGDATLSAASAQTDAGGQAQTTLTLGTTGRNTVQAQVAALTPVVFTSYAIGLSPKLNVPTGFNQNLAAIGDLNGDGLADVAVSNAASNTVSVLINTTAPGAASASLAAKVDFTTGSTPTAVAIADLNGDGKPDLAVSNRTSNTISVFINTTVPGATSPSFAARADFAVGSGPMSIAVGDLNGDGKPDLAAGDFGSTVSVLLNTTAPGASTATFAANVNFATGANAISVAVRDLNGDGKPDLAVACYGQNTIAILFNTMASGATVPTFAARVEVPAAGNPQWVAAGDLNGDGKPDLAVANWTSDSVSVLLNTTAPGAATPSFAARVDLYTGPASAYVAIGDLNGDGKLDLAVAAEGSGTVALLFNHTAPGATAPVFSAKVDLAVQLPFGVAIGDLNGDGKPDLTIGDYNSVSLFLNNTSFGRPLAFAAKSDLATAAGPLSVAMGDVNGDGKPDLAVPNGPSNTVSVFLNTTAPGAAVPTFAAKVDFATATWPQFVAVGDLNGDGKPDLAVIDNASSTVSVLLNTTAPGAATPAFASHVDFAVGSGPQSVTIRDLNGDGKPDLAVAGFSGNVVSVLFNTTAPGAATPSFATRTDLATGTRPSSVAYADFNGDGMPDLAATNWLASTTSVMLNTGLPGGTTPSFAAHVDLALDTGCNGVGVADFNGDGKLDIATSNFGFTSASVLLNTTAPGATTPSFTAQRTFSMAAGPQAIAVADLNGDGKPDFAIAAKTAGVVSIVLNTTTAGASLPSFATRVDFATGSEPYSVAIGDLNGDGLPDVAVANYTGNTVSVLLAK